MRVLYAGSPEPAATVLEQLLDNTSYEVVGVLTNPPSTHGRHKTLVPTPVASIAAEHGIPVFTPQHLDSQFRAQILPLGADILVCFAYGHIFGPKFLSLFPMGGVNLHPSLLPRYRGATPVPAAILHRDSMTAVTVQRLVLGMDEGDILVQEKIPLDGTETAGGLLDVCAQKGAALLVRLLLDAAERGTLPAGTPQTGEPSYTKVITKADARIDWGMSAADIDAFIRAYTPVPGAWTTYKEETLKILRAKVVSDQPIKNRGDSPGTVLGYQKGMGILVQTGDGILAVTELQRQGKKAMSAESFMNGERGIVGTVKLS